MREIHGFLEWKITGKESVIGRDSTRCERWGKGGNTLHDGGYLAGVRNQARWMGLVLLNESRNHEHSRIKVYPKEM